ncbi:unnamed protein product, partial [Scytosiphon promiscuus]
MNTNERVSDPLVQPWQQHEWQSASRRRWAGDDSSCSLDAVQGKTSSISPLPPIPRRKFPGLYVEPKAQRPWDGEGKPAAGESSGVYCCTITQWWDGIWDAFYDTQIRKQHEMEGGETHVFTRRTAHDLRHLSSIAHVLSSCMNHPRHMD